MVRLASAAIGDHGGVRTGHSRASSTTKLSLFSISMTATSRVVFAEREVGA